MITIEIVGVTIESISELSLVDWQAACVFGNRIVRRRTPRSCVANFILQNIKKTPILSQFIKTTIKGILKDLDLGGSIGEEIGAWVE